MDLSVNFYTFFSLKNVYFSEKNIFILFKFYLTPEFSDSSYPLSNSGYYVLTEVLMDLGVIFFIIFTQINTFVFHLKMFISVKILFFYTI
jgi:hypothetical protein